MSNSREFEYKGKQVKVSATKTARGTYLGVPIIDGSIPKSSAMGEGKRKKMLGASAVRRGQLLRRFASVGIDTSASGFFDDPQFVESASEHLTHAPKTRPQHIRRRADEADDARPAPLVEYRAHGPVPEVDVRVVGVF